MKSDSQSGANGETKPGMAPSPKGRWKQHEAIVISSASTSAYRRMTAMTISRILIVVAFLSGIAREGNSQTTSTETNSKDIISILRATATFSAKDFHRIAVETSSFRNEIIDQLIRELRREQDAEKQVRLCFLLGDFRANEAISDLSEKLTLTDPSVGNEPILRIPLWGKYPAQEALIKIGLSTIPKMIENLKTSEDDLTRRLSADVIWQSLRPAVKDSKEAKSIARGMIESAIAVQKDAKQKANLLRSLIYYER